MGYSEEASVGSVEGETILSYRFDARYLSSNSYRNYLLLDAEPILTTLGPLLLIWPP